MDKNNKRLIVVGDRALIHVQEGDRQVGRGVANDQNSLRLVTGYW